MTPHLLWLNAHQDVCNPLAQWDTLHLQRAVNQAADLCWLHEPYPDPTLGGSALVMISGQHHTTAEDVAHLNGALSTLDRAVIVVHSDEASLFAWEQIRFPAERRWWFSTPRRSTHGHAPDGSRFFGEGSGPPVALPPVPRDLDVAFMGQDTHPSRHQLVDVLSRMDPERVLCEPTAGFLQGRAHPDFMVQLARAKVAPCPSGAATADSFRLYQALDAGCVPVVENFTPDGRDHETWQMMYPDGKPFPAIASWADLPLVLPDLLDRWEPLAAECQVWWKAQQARMVDDLRTDLAWLGATVRP